MTNARWIGNRRADGLEVVAGIDGYAIIPANKGLAVDRCPCCDKNFPRNDVGSRGARLVADMLYPMTGAVDAND